MPTYTIERKKDLPADCGIKWSPYFRSLLSAQEFINKVESALGFGYIGRLKVHYSTDEIGAAIVREENKFEAPYPEGRTRLPEWVPTYDIPDMPDDFSKTYGGVSNYAYIANKNKRHAESATPLVAYTPTFDHLMRDRQLVVPISKYLAGHPDKFSGDEISRMVAKFSAEFSQVEFKFTRDPALVLKIFTKYSHKAESSDYTSCMNYEPAEFDLPSDMHPAQVYVTGNGTLSIAYLENKRNGKIVARAVVSEKNKFFVRIYGIEEMDKLQLRAELERAGYTRKGDYCGERIDIVIHPKYQTRCITPYLDGKIKNFTKDGTITSGGILNGETTAGWADIPITHCQKTGIEFDRDLNVSTRVIVSLSPYVEQEWARSVAIEHAFRDEYMGMFVANNTDTPVQVAVHRNSRGKITYQTWAQNYGSNRIFFCDKTKKYYANYEFRDRSVITGRNGDGTWQTETWCHEVTNKEMRHVLRYIKWEGPSPNWVSLEVYDTYVAPAIVAVRKEDPINFKIGDIVYLKQDGSVYGYPDYRFGQRAVIIDINYDPGIMLPVRIQWLYGPGLEAPTIATSCAKFEWLERAVDTENINIQPAVAAE